MRGLSPGLGTMNVHVAHLAKKIPFIRRLVKERDSAVSGHSAAISSATRHSRPKTLRLQSATRER